MKKYERQNHNEKTEIQSEHEIYENRIKKIMEF